MGFSEIIFVLVLALILFGPEDLPDIARAIGRIIFEIRKAATDVTKEFSGALDNPVNTVSKSLDKLLTTDNSSTASAKDLTNDSNDSNDESTRESMDVQKEEEPIITTIDTNEWKIVKDDNDDDNNSLAEAPIENISTENKDASR